MAQLQAVLLLLGRICIGGPFVIVGAALIPYWSTYTSILSEQQIPVPDVFLIIGIIFLILGGVSLILGYKARIGAVLLMAALIAATFTVGGFAHMGQCEHPIGAWMLWNNLAMFGGLIYVLTFGAGTISLDRKTRPDIT